MCDEVEGVEAGVLAPSPAVLEFADVSLAGLLMLAYARKAEMQGNEM